MKHIPVSDEIGQRLKVAAANRGMTITVLSENILKAGLNDIEREEASK